MQDVNVPLRQMTTNKKHNHALSIQCSLHLRIDNRTVTICSVPNFIQNNFISDELYACMPVGTKQNFSNIAQGFC